MENTNSIAIWFICPPFYVCLCVPPPRLFIETVFLRSPDYPGAHSEDQDDLELT